MREAATLSRKFKESVSIPDDELVFFAVRSGGPGGQNVNKVASKVRLSFDFMRSSALSDSQKTTLSRSKKIQEICSQSGVISITSQRHRSQLLNRSEARKRLLSLIESALRPVPKRIKTKPSLASKRKRLDTKARRSLTKRLRRVDSA